FVKQKILPPRAAECDINCRKDTFVGEFPVQLQLHIAGTLELFKNNFVHFGTGFGKGCCKYSQGTAILDVTGSSEEPLWFVKCIGINTSAQHFPRCRLHRVESTGQPCY